MNFTVKRVDLLFTERYYTTPGDQPVKVRCRRCGGNLIFSKDPDDPKDRFYCYGASPLNSCFNKRRFEIDKMLSSALQEALEADYAVKDLEDLVVVEEATDGVTRFSKTRPMRLSERVNYYLKALDGLRAKIARREKT